MGNSPSSFGKKRRMRIKERTKRELKKKGGMSKLKAKKIVLKLAKVVELKHTLKLSENSNKKWHGLQKKAIAKMNRNRDRFLQKVLLFFKKHKTNVSELAYTFKSLRV